MASPEEPGGISVLRGGASILTSLQPERKRRRRETRRKLPGRIHHHNNKHFQKLGNSPRNQPPNVSPCARRGGSPLECLGFRQDPGMA